MNEPETNKPDCNLLELTRDIVSAYCNNNAVSISELPKVINEVHGALEQVQGHAPISKHSQKPAVPVKKSLHDDYIVCLEDGKHFKSLKRHLRSHFDLSPEQYREKWGLPADYPMVAPNYAKARSRLAKEIGLGRKPGAAAANKFQPTIQ